MSCMLPVESLILRVLHILSDAGQITNGSEVNNDHNGLNNSKDIHPIPVVKAPPKHACRVQGMLQPSNSTGFHIQGRTAVEKNANSYICNPLKENINPNVLVNLEDKSCASFVYNGRTNPSFQNRTLISGDLSLQPSTSTSFKNMNSDPEETNTHGYCSDAPLGNGMDNPILILDKPLVMHEANRLINVSSSMPVNHHAKYKRVRIEVPKNDRLDGRNAVCKVAATTGDRVVQAKGFDDVQVLGATSFRDRCLQSGRVYDGMYNKMYVANQSDRISNNQHVSAIIPSPNVSARGNSASERFPITDEERGLYNVICKMGHSQWSCQRAVQFSLTSVTFSSLGESVEYGGKVDNFFVAVMCRKFFEDVHPRQSKKHFFYPKVGGCLYTYSCSYDVNTVQKSFLGANSAYKLHLSHKLCFPLILHKHWFVFIVDLENKQFVFLDSLFDRNHNFHIDARSKLINAFTECWYQHAEVKLDVDCFSVVYPPVPKQHNVLYCGIFAVKFMELWDQSVDLRCLFDQSDIPNIRVKLAIDLFFNKANSIDKSTVINMYKQDINPLAVK